MLERGKDTRRLVNVVCIVGFGEIVDVVRFVAVVAVVVVVSLDNVAGIKDARARVGCAEVVDKGGSVDCVGCVACVGGVGAWQALCATGRAVG